MNLWASLLLVVYCSLPIKSLENNVCSKSRQIPYTITVLKSKNVPFNILNWLGFSKTNSRDEWYIDTVTNYKDDTRYKCCPGYTGSTDNCKPFCFDCPINSHCATPFNCACDAGYAGYPCNPVCEPSCGPNQFCKEPNQCECLEGYRSRESGDSIECYPVCEPECGPHSNCLKPGECQCDEGYSRSKENDNCQPNCSQGCQHGICIASETCLCPEGYEKTKLGCQLRTTSTTGSSTYASTLSLSEESTSTATSAPSSISPQTEPIQNCSKDCICWSEFTEDLSLPVKCAILCLDEPSMDLSCIDLSQCRCDPQSDQLMCKERVYLCADERQAAEGAGQRSAKRSSSSVALVVWWVFIVVLVGSMIFLVGFYMNRRWTQTDAKPSFSEVYSLNFDYDL